MAESLQTWFKREILTHEELLTRFLSRAWPHASDVADIRQEVYARVFESARQSRPHTPKAFLFATARHHIADRIRRERVVSIQALGDADFLNVLVDEISPERKLSAYQDLERLARAFDLLPPKCRNVVWLRRVKDLSQKEVAARLGLDQKTVEQHLATGARWLVNHLRANKLHPNATYRGVRAPIEDREVEHEHGKREGD